MDLFFRTSELCEVSGRQRVFISDCTAETDARLPDAVNQGYTNLSIRTVDSDIVILAVMTAQRLNIDELWFHFDTGRNFRFLAAHGIAKTLGPNWYQALPFFDAFAGCDQCRALDLLGLRSACSSRSIGRREAAIYHGQWRSGGLHAS